MITPANLCLEVRRLAGDWGLGQSTLAEAIARWRAAFGKPGPAGKGEGK